MIAQGAHLVSNEVGGKHHNNLEDDHTRPPCTLQRKGTIHDANQDEMEQEQSKTVIDHLKRTKVRMERGIVKDRERTGEQHQAKGVRSAMINNEEGEGKVGLGEKTNERGFLQFPLIRATW